MKTTHSDASSPKPKAKGKRRKRKDEFAGTDVYIPGIPKHTINKIKIGAYVDITDCIPSYDEQREDGITVTLDGRTRVTRIPGSRPALPMSFEEWFAGASVLCRIRESFNPDVLASNNSYIEMTRLMYKNYPPAIVYEYDSAWRLYCSIDNIKFFPPFAPLHKRTIN